MFILAAFIAACHSEADWPGVFKLGIAIIKMALAVAPLQ
jgi:hypothetical protein